MDHTPPKLGIPSRLLVRLQRLFPAPFQLLRWFTFIFLPVLAAIVLFGKHGWLAQRALQQQQELLQQELQHLQKRQQTLSWQIDALKHDPQYIEHLARKRLGLTRPQDRIYR